MNNVEALTAALQAPEPRVIVLDGMLTLTEAIKVTADKDNPNGNKTLIGLGANSGLTGAGLDLSYADNVIVRNLKIAKASGATRSRSRCRTTSGSTTAIYRATGPTRRRATTDWSTSRTDPSS